MAELGFMGMMVDPKYGGSGLDSVSYVLQLLKYLKLMRRQQLLCLLIIHWCAGLEKYLTRAENEVFSSSCEGSNGALPVRAREVQMLLLKNYCY
jgi:hypothetical protein